MKRMGEVVDGQYQKYVVESGDYIRKDFFGAYPQLLEMVEPSFRRADSENAARRPRSGEGLRGVQGRDGQQGLADRHPGQDDQGLRTGRKRRRQEHHAPAEEAERGGTPRVPLPVRHPDFRRGHREGSVLPAAGRQPGNAVSQGAARVARRLFAGAQADHGCRSRRRRTTFFRNFSKAPANAKSPRRWRSCAS